MINLVVKMEELNEVFLSMTCGRQSSYEPIEEYFKICQSIYEEMPMPSEDWIQAIRVGYEEAILEPVSRANDLRLRLTKDMLDILERRCRDGEIGDDQS